MYKLRFDAWVNGNRSADVGHMGTQDDTSGYCYELAMGEAIDWDYAEADAMERGLPNPYQGFPRDVTVTDVTTGRSRTTETKKLIVRREKKIDYFNRQLMKMDAVNRNTLRFTHLFYLEVNVSDDEYRTLIVNTFVRGYAGGYNMMKEAQLKYPLITRCLTLLEILAGLRNIQLGRGTAFQVLLDFARQTGGTVKNDPLLGA